MSGFPDSTFRSAPMVIAVVLFIAVVALTVAVVSTTQEIRDNRTLMCEGIIGNVHNTARDSQFVIDTCLKLGISQTTGG